MSTLTSTRPDVSEHAPYFSRYIDLVREGDAITALESQMSEALAILKTIPEARGEHRYAPDKWTIKEVLGHVSDCERVFAYRALRFGRRDTTPLAGFDENHYTPAGAFNRRTLADLIAEWQAVRGATMALLRSLEPEAWTRRGKANENEISVRALAFVIAGHGKHHVDILKTRYLV